MPYLLPAGAAASSIKCPNCDHEIAHLFKKTKILGIPNQTCRKCGTEIYIENYVPWQMMSQKQKTGEMLSLMFRSVVLGIAFGGLIGAVLLFIIILIYPVDLSDFPMLTYYAIATALPVLILMLRPWFKFYKIYKQGKKWMLEKAP